MKREHHRVLPDACPLCGKIVDGASSIEEIESEAPREGDFSVCLGCGERLRWRKRDGRLALDLLTPADLADLRSQPETLQRLDEVALALRRYRLRRPVR